MASANSNERSRPTSQRSAAHAANNLLFGLNDDIASEDSDLDEILDDFVEDCDLPEDGEN